MVLFTVFFLVITLVFIFIITVLIFIVTLTVRVFFVLLWGLELLFSHGSDLILSTVQS